MLLERVRYEAANSILFEFHSLNSIFLKQRTMWFICQSNSSLIELTKVWLMILPLNFCLP